MIIVHLCTDVGLGHCSRMLVLAQQLQKNGQSCLFFISNERQDQYAIIRKKGFDSIQYNTNDSMNTQIASLINATMETTWVIDTKYDVSSEIMYLKKRGVTVVLYDNATDARWLADKNVYPTPLFDPDDLDWTGYAGSVTGGWAETLLSESILNLKHKLNQIEKKNILITFGGTDPNSITLMVMKACQDVDPVVPIQVVIGPAFVHGDAIVALNTAMNNRFELIEGCDDLSSYIACATCVVTAVGTTIFEALYLKTKCVIISNYTNDQYDEAKLKKITNTVVLGWFETVDAKMIVSVL